MVTTTVLIVGAGIAGTSLAHALLKHGAEVRVVDSPSLSRASHVAAGVVNPIAGKRFSLLWRHEDLLHTARQWYNAIEQEYGEQFLRPMPVLRLFVSAEEYVWWLERCANDAARSSYMRLARSEEIPEEVHAEHGGVWIHQAVQVNISAVVQSLRDWLHRAGRLHEEQVRYERLSVTEGGVRYTMQSGEQICADYVVCAEGWRAIQNPWLNDIPLVPAQGDVLTIRPHEPLTAQAMVSKGVFIVPLSEATNTEQSSDAAHSSGGQQLWKLGATYQWDAIEDLADTPRETGKQTLVRGAQSLLRAEFDVVRHEAAVRPASRDTKPIVGVHPLHPRCLVVNGFGAKGAVYAPFVAQHLVAMLERSATLPAEIDVLRFAECFRL